MRRSLVLAFLGLIVSLFLFESSAHADKGKRPDPDAMAFLTDGRGHYVAVPKNRGTSSGVYYARGKGPFYAQAMHGGGAGSDGSYYWTFWAPQQPTFTRSGRRDSAHANGGVQLKAGRWNVRCGRRRTPFHPVDAKTRRALLNRSFEKAALRRQPYLFARDDDGVYYLVDQKSHADRRLFVGKAGAMKRIRLSSVIIDEVGDVFSSSVGKLVRNRVEKRTTWKPRKGAAQKIYELSSRHNEYLLYVGLGVYSGRLGTPCDDL